MIKPIWLCALIVSITLGAAPAMAQTFTEFNVSTGGAQPSRIVAGPDGQLWFTETAANKIGRVTTAGVITEFPISTAGAAPMDITAGPDGALWFGEYGANKIGRITTAGVITEFSLPGADKRPLGISIGPDGALWFAEEGGNAVGRMTTTGTVTEFLIPTGSAAPQGIAIGPDGAMWFTEAGGNRIGRITMAGTVTEFVVPTAGSSPMGITAGPDGALWFTENVGNKIGRITTAGAFAELATPSVGSRPQFIRTGPDGALWFTENETNRIGKITTTGTITEFAVPTAASHPVGIAAGPDGQLWFTESSANKIGRFPPPASASPLVAATLPSSRSVQVGATATAFATLLNTGAAAVGCAITPVTPVPAVFSYQTTNPATNALTGTPNTPVSIAAGGAQTFVLSFTANAPFSATNIVLGFSCFNVEAVAPITGVNTLLLTFDANPVPDMIAVGLTPSGDGYSRTGGVGNTGLFAVAAANIGAGGQLTAKAVPLDPTTPVSGAVCQTNPSTGACLAAPAATATATIAQNQNTTWSAFLLANSAIPQDPARNRVALQFLDGAGVIRGSTSTAITTLVAVGPPGAPSIVSATAANTSAVIAFAPPAASGASPIIGYTASCQAGSATAITAAGDASPIIVIGLTNGTAYSCSVTAASASGVSPRSATLNVTPNPSAGTPAGVAEFTTVDFGAILNYSNPTLPAYYDATVAALDNTPPNNQANDRIATLGRVLFYDKRLSINDAISCSSCHKQGSGFTDPNRFSTGFSGSAFTTAHAMRLGNVRYYRPGQMFWDKRAASVEAQASQPIQNAVEMGWDASAGGIAALITKLGATSYYPDLFNFAFGSPTITETRMQQAISQFERAMVSTTSRWDTGYAQVFNANGPNRNLGVDLPNFTAQENRGRQLFMAPPNAPGGGAGCSACHVPPTFALAANSNSNGLDAGETRIFKSPSLKNLGVTGPYMHDGRFSTIEQVVDFYDHGIQAGPALDNRLRGPQGQGVLVLNLSAQDKAALAAFLRTLDDANLNNDAKFSSAVVK